ncbi:Ig-like domain-containing protein [Streptomyces sp. NBC_00344]|uniref:Ig-like domain-containing protein n=1 Tax=Streptomyces sp. NBC_00344 TaxID=2975720 RepID=UPI002E1BDB22
MNHLLCRGRATGTEPSRGAVYAALYSSADPLSGVAPGDQLQLGLSVAADGGAPYGCAYLMEDSLLDAADVLDAQQLEYFPEQRCFRVRADPGTHASGVLLLRIKHPTGAPRLRPQIRVAVPDGPGRKPVRTGRLSDAALPVLAPAARGLRIVVRPGEGGTVHATSALPGSTPISVTQPAYGTARLTADGWVSYQPRPGFRGYDRFQYTVATADGGKSSAPVNVHVGELGEVPGVFPEHTGAAAFRAWQWPELTGEMPWPQASGTTQAQQGPAQEGQTW